MPPGRWAGRGSFLANPFSWRRFGFPRSWRLHKRWIDRKISIAELQRLGFCPREVDALLRLRERVLRALPTIAGVDLVCSCAISSRWCHVDTVMVRADRLIPAAIVPY